MGTAQSAGQATRAGGVGAPLMLSVSGCRGVVGSTITPEVAARFAGCFAGWLRERFDEANPAVVFGRDGRAGAEALRMATVSGLLAAGVRVIDLGVAATPTVGVMVEHHGAQGALILTASHNPAEWNGLKCLVRDVVDPEGAARSRAPAASDAQEIIDRFRAGAPALAAHDAQGELECDDTAAHVHVARVLRAIERIEPVERIRERGFKVFVNSVNASGATAARLLLDALGCDATHPFADGSGVFPHPPEPTAENLAGFARDAAGAGADVCFAQDTDADRLAILDETGAYIGEEYTLALAAQAVIECGADHGFDAAVAANLSTSRMLDDVAAAHGQGAWRVVRSAVGEANVVEAMVRERCAMGGEGNGGVIWPPVTYVRDSVGAMALTLALMSRTGKTVRQLVAETPAYIIEKRKAPLRGDVTKALAALRERYAGERVNAEDGVRIDLGEGEQAAWLHVRPSNTEPILRLIAEARTRERAAALLDDAERLIAGA